VDQPEQQQPEEAAVERYIISIAPLNACHVPEVEVEAMTLPLDAS
jgi:hypothetical protein